MKLQATLPKSIFQEASSLLNSAGRVSHSDQPVARSLHELQPSLELDFFEQIHPIDKSGVQIDRQK